jgi:diaminopimelate decarboxylase
MTQWMQFIQMRPNVVMIDVNGQPHIIRNKETIDTLHDMEVLPEYLKKFEL